MRSVRFLLGLGASLVLTWVLGSPRRADSAPPRLTVNDELLVAVRDGDAAAVTALLQRGADVNARDEDAATALMHAAADADLPTMKLLLEAGADLNAASKNGATALLWALHDVEKVKLLLERGARNLDAAVLGAAGIAGATPVLKLLVEHGASLNPRKTGFIPLMAASRTGDPSAVRYLIDHGADVRASTQSGYTALYAAASWPDNTAIVALLLEKGADAATEVAVSQPANDLFTPVLAAAMRGDAESLKRLLEKGGKANQQGGDFGRTPLLAAATTGSELMIKLLLAAGADVNVNDALGNSPLQWARRRGETRIVRLLNEAGARERPGRPEAAGLSRLQTVVDGESVKRALARSLPLLQHSAQTFTARRRCVSCHHQALVAMTVGLARKQGFVVNDELADQERSAVQSRLAKNREAIRLGGGVTDDLIPAYALAGLAAEAQRPNALTDAIVHYLALKQRLDGSWQTPVFRPPQDASAFTFTALAVRGLSAFGPRGRAGELQERIRRARDWLLQARPGETEEKAFHLLGLSWANADRRAAREAAERLLREQRDDGGWSQLATLPSDAYATGAVLYALHEGAGLSVKEAAYRRGVDYLLRTQLADGSWFVPSRSFPLQPYFTTGFPHGRSEFISLSATGWATMALALTAEPGSGK